MFLSKIVGASKVHNFKLKMLTQQMDLVQLLGEIRLNSSDGKLQ